MTKKIFVNFLIFIITVFLIIYFAIQVKSIFIDAMETEYAVLSAFDDTIELKCTIVRDETLIESEYGGTYNYVVSDGEKLSVGQKIANIYTTDSQYRIQEQINEIDDKISILNDSSVEHNYFTLNISKIDKDIANMFSEYRSCIESGDYALALQIKKELLVILNKRYLVVNAVKDFGDVVETLENEKKNLTTLKSDVDGSVTSPASGYFYSDVDGYEGILTTQLIDEGTVDEILSALESDPGAISKNAVGKVASEYDWYTVCTTDKDISQLFVTGEYYDVSYPYSVGHTIKSLLSNKIVQNDSDKVVLVFQSSSNNNSFNFMRNQIAEVRLDKFSGLRVHKDALRIVDGEEGVFILNGNTIEFKRANKIYENDGYYIISVTDPQSELPEEEKSSFSYLKMYDAVINNGKELYHGKTIG